MQPLLAARGSAAPAELSFSRIRFAQQAAGHSAEMPRIAAPMPHFCSQHFIPVKNIPVTAISYQFPHGHGCIRCTSIQSQPASRDRTENGSQPAVVSQRPMTVNRQRVPSEYCNEEYSMLEMSADAMNKINAGTANVTTVVCRRECRRVGNGAEGKAKNGVQTGQRRVPHRRTNAGMKCSENGTE